ncbi:MAG: hypothetical protein ACPG4T_05930 [Nannocystaceae bacterium]
MFSFFALLCVPACVVGVEDSNASENTASSGNSATSSEETTIGPESTSSDSEFTGTESNPTSSESEATSTDPTTETTTETTTGGTDQGFPGSEFLSRFAGLWSGPATMTVLGSFPLTNFDMQAATPHLLFGRVDLDPLNSLRFAFSIETHKGEDVLIFRNGGQFLGLNRDTRTSLVEHNADEGTYRFCAIEDGCEYVDATFAFEEPDALTLTVAVKGKTHLLWKPVRKEKRELPDPFPADNSSQGGPGTPFPTMPEVNLGLAWNEPLAAPADAWLILSKTPCDLQLNCTHSRSLKTTVPAGATAAELVIEQIHPGEYYLNAILDRNQNMQGTLFPDSGDGIGSLNKPIEVDPEGQSQADTVIFFNLP